MSWLQWLQGKKTYIIVILAAIFNIGVAFGLWDVNSGMWEFINALLVFLGLGTLRAGVTKSSSK